MKNWEEDDKNGHCASAQDLSDAQQVADTLGIKLHTINFSSDYWDEVFSDFLAEHKKGRTPNPDVLCNQKIKFKVFLEHAHTLGADKIATGHYARIIHKNQRAYLTTAIDSNKDQSYFLYLLNQTQLQHSLFPLGNLHKSQVRKLAQENHLITADKKESMGICFIGKRDFSSFLQTYLPKQPGNMVDQNGQFIKQHQGLAFYTIGQRKGLGIGGGFGTSGAPWFVADKRLKTNELVVVQGEHPLLYERVLSAEKVHWISDKPTFPLTCFAKIRYRQTAQLCTISQNTISQSTISHLSHNTEQLEVVFENPQRAIAPGQSVVFYQNTTCLGGAIIQHRGKLL